MIHPAGTFKTLRPTLPTAATWTVEADLPYLSGHFPGNPILPAIAIVDASTFLLQQVLGQPQLAMSKVVVAKFMSPILPGQVVQITWHDIGDGEWRFEWKDERSIKLLAKLNMQIK